MSLPACPEPGKWALKSQPVLASPRAGGAPGWTTLATASQVLFCHIHKTGGVELLFNFVAPFTRAHNISIRTYYKAEVLTKGITHYTQGDHRLKALTPRDAKAMPRFLYGHLVRWEMHWVPRMPLADDRRYVVMLRDPVRVKLSLYFHQRPSHTTNITKWMVHRLCQFDQRQNWPFLPDGAFPARLLSLARAA